MIQPKYHVFLCSSCRLNGTVRGFCAAQGARDLLQTLVEEIDELDLHADVMVTHTGCFGICDKGPVMVVYPEGVWYGKLTPEAVVQIVSSHFSEGIPVSSFQI